MTCHHAVTGPKQHSKRHVPSFTGADRSMLSEIGSTAAYLFIVAILPSSVSTCRASMDQVEERGKPHNRKGAPGWHQQTCNPRISHIGGLGHPSPPIQSSR